MFALKISDQLKVSIIYNKNSSGFPDVASILPPSLDIIWYAQKEFS
jgi:hypothetical protein